MIDDRSKNKQTSDVHWEKVWARLQREGRVDVPTPPREPYFPSSCDGLRRAIRGETSQVLSVKQSEVGWLVSAGRARNRVQTGIRKDEG